MKKLPQQMSGPYSGQMPRQFLIQKTRGNQMTFMRISAGIFSAQTARV